MRLFSKRVNACNRSGVAVKVAAKEERNDLLRIRYSKQQFLSERMELSSEWLCHFATRWRIAPISLFTGDLMTKLLHTLLLGAAAAALANVAQAQSADPSAPPPSMRSGAAATTGTTDSSSKDPYVQRRESNKQAKDEYNVKKKAAKAEYEAAKKDADAELKASGAHSSGAESSGK